MDTLDTAKAQASSMVASAAPAAPHPLHSAIDKWFSDSFLGTRLGNDTETWNLVHVAKEDLKQRLAPLVR